MLMYIIYPELEQSRLHCPNQFLWNTFKHSVDTLVFQESSTRQVFRTTEFFFFFSFNITLELLRLHIRLILCILIINLYIIIGSRILRAAVFSSIKTTIMWVCYNADWCSKGGETSCWVERVRADVALPNSSWPPLLRIGHNFVKMKYFMKSFLLLLLLLRVLKAREQPVRRV